MTVAQLESATARLGFTPSIDDGGLLLRDAAARALNEVALARPRIANVYLWHYPDLPILYEGPSLLSAGEHKLSATDGTAFHIRISGRGYLTIRRRGQTDEYSFATKEGEAPAVLSGLLPKGVGEMEIRIICLDRCRLLSLAVYDGTCDGMPPDPTAPKEYSLPKHFMDFGELIGTPTDEGGRPLCEGADGDYQLNDKGTLAVFIKKPCRLRLCYRRTLTLPEQGELPITDEEAALLPLYCAAYVFLDDEPEKAAFYLARFQEGLRRLSHEAGSVHRYNDTTGWG